MFFFVPEMKPLKYFACRTGSNWPGLIIPASFIVGTKIKFEFPAKTTAHARQIVYIADQLIERNFVGYRVRFERCDIPSSFRLWLWKINDDEPRDNYQFRGVLGIGLFINRRLYFARFSYVNSSVWLVVNKFELQQ